MPIQSYTSVYGNVQGVLCPLLSLGRYLVVSVRTSGTEEEDTGEEGHNNSSHTHVVAPVGIPSW